MKNSDVFIHWAEWLDKSVIDWAEPSCWACGDTFNGRYDLVKSSSTFEEIAENWNRAPLQKCHIIAKQFGGLYEPSNLFLMCRSCHDKAPNTKSKETFMMWVESENRFKSIQNELILLMGTYGIESPEELFSIMESEDFKKFFKDNIGLHYNQVVGGSTLTISSLVGLAYEYKNR